MARLAIAHVLALNLGPVPCLQPPATTCNLVPVPPGLLTVPVHCLSVQTRLTLALLKDRPCRSSPVPPRSSPTSFTVENSSGLPFFPLLAEPPPPSLPLSLRSAISFSSFTPPFAAFLVGQDDDTSTSHFGLERVSTTSIGRLEANHYGQLPADPGRNIPHSLLPCLVPSCPLGDPCLAWPVRLKVPFTHGRLLQIDRRCSRQEFRPPSPSSPRDGRDNLSLAPISSTPFSTLRPVDLTT